MSEPATAPAQVDVLVVVVAYNSATVIARLLDSVPAALGNLRAEVIVVDNASTDDTGTIVDARADCRLVRAANDGYAAGINRGVESCSSSARSAPVLALNPDMVLHPSSVACLVEALRRGAGSIIAPRVLDSGGRLHHSLRREPTIPRTLGLNFTGLAPFSEYLNHDAEYRSARTVDWALGAALLMSRDCYDAMGGWDESFFLYSEETEFCLRARDRGMRTVYEPSSVVTHIGGGSGQTGWTHSMQLINRIRLYRRRRGTAHAWVFFALTALREATWLTRRSALSRAALRAMLRPSTRPPQLHCSTGLLPR